MITYEKSDKRAKAVFDKMRGPYFCEREEYETFLYALLLKEFADCRAEAYIDGYNARAAVEMKPIQPAPLTPQEHEALKKIQAEDQDEIAGGEK